LAKNKIRMMSSLKAALLYYNRKRKERTMTNFDEFIKNINMDATSLFYKILNIKKYCSLMKDPEKNALNLEILCGTLVAQEIDIEKLEDLRIKNNMSYDEFIEALENWRA
jgi:hypothetical protein